MEISIKDFSFRVDEEEANEELAKYVKIQEALFRNLQFMVIEIERDIEGMTIEMSEVKCNRLEKTYEKSEANDLLIWSVCEVDKYPHVYS